VKVPSTKDNDAEVTALIKSVFCPDLIKRLEKYDSISTKKNNCTIASKSTSGIYYAASVPLKTFYKIREDFDVFTASNCVPCNSTIAFQTENPMIVTLWRKLYSCAF
jgi:hypothetical protein